MAKQEQVRPSSGAGRTIREAVILNSMHSIRRTDRVSDCAQQPVGAQVVHVCREPHPWWELVRRCWATGAEWGSDWEFEYEGETRRHVLVQPDEGTIWVSHRWMRGTLRDCSLISWTPPVVSRSKGVSLSNGKTPTVSHTTTTQSQPRKSSWEPSTPHPGPRGSSRSSNAQQETSKAGYTTPPRRAHPANTPSVTPLARRPGQDPK